MAIQVVASASCFLMLRTVFGDRWGILAPLALYLFAAMSPEVVMWWAASLNGLPIQAAFFLLVTAVVLWARHRRARAVLGAALALALAVASGPRGLAMAVPVGVFMTLFLAPGGRWFAKPWTVARLHWPFVVPLAALAAGYLTLYAITTPSPVAAVGDAPALQLGRQLVGIAWLPSLVGGPWQWQLIADPVSVAAPPRVAHVVAVGDRHRRFWRSWCDAIRDRRSRPSRCSPPSCSSPISPSSSGARSRSESSPRSSPATWPTPSR